MKRKTSTKKADQTTTAWAPYPLAYIDPNGKPIIANIQLGFRSDGTLTWRPKDWNAALVAAKKDTTIQTPAPPKIILPNGIKR